MDPVSVAASIVAFLQVASSILSFCYHVRAGLKNVPPSLIRFIREIREIRNIVEALQSSLDDCNTDGAAGGQANSAMYTSLQRPLSTCLAELKIIESKIKTSLTSDESSKCRIMLCAIKWELKGRELRDLLEQISKCRSVLTLAIGSQNLAILVNVEKVTIDMNSTVLETSSRLQSLANAFESASTDSRERNVVDWLSPLRPWENHNAALKNSGTGTCDWLMRTKEFMDWAEGKIKYLWLTGPPGGGKTTLLASSIELLVKDPVLTKQGVAYGLVYCDFRQPDSLSVTNVLGALLGQILVQTRKFPKRLFQEYERHTRPACYSSPSQNLLQELLVYISRQQRVVLFIDALDELSHDDGRELQDILRYLTASSGRISVFTVSRTHVEIHESREDASHIRLENHIEQIDLDIKDYMSRRLQADRGFQWLSTGFRKTVLDLLSARSQGMFRWAECQLNIMSEARTVKEIRRTIESLPDGLNQTYRRILAQIPLSDQAIFKNALTWLVFATEPLTIEQLWEAVAIEEGSSRIDEEARLRSTSDILVLGNSLITTAQEGKQVKLAHLSVRDYLLSASIVQDPSLSKFCLGQIDGDARIAIYCLTYLMFSDLGDGPADSAEAYLERLRCMPLLKYASKAWPYHVRRAKQSRELDILVLKFFQSRGNFMSWVQVINADANFKWNVYPQHATSLYYAASFGLLGVVQHLLSPSGASEGINKPGSRFGGTPLHAATIRGHTHIMEILLEHGADPSKGDYNKVTPLHSASAQGHLSVVQLLLQHKANTGARDSMDYKTPLEWAQMGEKDEVISLLREKESPKGGEDFALFPLESGTTCSRGSDTPSTSTASEDIAIWSPTHSFFPDFYERRSGTASSILVSFEIHGKLTILNPEPTQHSLISSHQDSPSPAVW
ncbi:hypothetical protein SCARD494_06731 [Seiridium cardinale]